LQFGSSKELAIVRYSSSAALSLLMQGSDSPRPSPISIFDREGLGQARQAEHYRFLWDGSKISAIYDYRSDSTGTPILPEDIFAPRL